MNNELKPCPFCGRTPELELFNDGFFDYARIRCCHLIFDWCSDKTGEQAIKAWNNRVELKLRTNEDIQTVDEAIRTINGLRIMNRELKAKLSPKKEISDSEIIAELIRRKYDNKS